MTTKPKHFEKPAGFLAGCDASEDNHNGSALYLLEGIEETLKTLRRKYVITAIESNSIPAWAKEFNAVRIRFHYKDQPSPIQKALDAAASRDIRIAKKHGSVVIAQTKLGTLQLVFNGSAFTLTQWGTTDRGPATIARDAGESIIRSELKNAYDVVTDECQHSWRAVTNGEHFVLYHVCDKCDVRQTQPIPAEQTRIENELSEWGHPSRQ
jgi:hypothetical protein